MVKTAMVGTTSPRRVTRSRPLARPGGPLPPRQIPKTAFQAVLVSPTKAWRRGGHGVLDGVWLSAAGLDGRKPAGSATPTTPGHGRFHGSAGASVARLRFRAWNNVHRLNCLWTKSAVAAPARPAQSKVWDSAGVAEVIGWARLKGHKGQRRTDQRGRIRDLRFQISKRKRGGDKLLPRRASFRAW